MQLGFCLLKYYYSYQVNEIICIEALHEDLCIIFGYITKMAYFDVMKKKMKDIPYLYHYKINNIIKAKEKKSDLRFLLISATVNYILSWKRHLTFVWNITCLDLIWFIQSIYAEHGVVKQLVIIFNETNNAGSWIICIVFCVPDPTHCALTTPIFLNRYLFLSQ